MEGRGTDCLGSSLSNSYEGIEGYHRSVRQLRHPERTQAGTVGSQEQPEQPAVQVSRISIYASE